MSAACSRLRRALVPIVAAVAFALLVAPIAVAGPFIWDQDNDHIDDRIETVHLLGYTFAFEGGDTLQQKRIDVTPGLVFGVYVNYAAPPTAADLATLTALGVPVLYRYEGIPSVRGLATFAQIQAIVALPGVAGVEAVPILYARLREGAATIAARDPSGRVFPTWAGTGGATGQGVVVAIIDTGINDAAEGNYPGHESLIGRCLGGADFTRGDSLLDTPRDGSENPSDHGGSVTQAHGTHVAGIVLGNGGVAGYAVGVAPDARFVDVKALSDAGNGTGIAEAIDWCIHNRSRAWGPIGYQGIQVVNLSLSSVDPTDGNDAASRLAARAAELGIVVVASMGNDGADHHVPSPAGGDGVIAVGAIDDQRTAADADDRFAGISDYGPRPSDGDGNAADEEKPDLVAPGIAVLSTNGDLLTDGAQYQRLTGTSMAAAFVSGAAAALKSAYPSLTPARIAAVLRATAHRELGGVPPGVSGVDPGWSSPIGFGVVDLYAAELELAQPERTQIRRLSLSGSNTMIDAEIRTMRERGAAYVVFERATDVSGAPGVFTPIDSAATAGDSTLADGTDLTRYARQWAVPVDERGAAFWYRAAYTEGGARYSTSPLRFVSPTGPPAATVRVTIVHDAFDSDVSGDIEVGSSAPLAGGQSVAGPAFTIPLPGSAAAIASDWVTGTSTTGNVAWTFAIDVPAGVASAWLPPAADKLWVLRVAEGGYINRSGRVLSYQVVWHAEDGDHAYNGGPAPVQTIEGESIYLTAPDAVTGVGAVPGAAARIGPNPIAGGEAVTFTLPRAPRGDLRVFDLAGREVGRAPFTADAGAWRARWESRDRAGRPVPAGLYFARAGDAAVARVVVLGR
ncbi:MAG: S8 family serine peptidase [Candidatus Eisenbacteria bacterium]|nr:S8 family serine peptidase [Candidatus Eisenbacteria bacterium]